MPALRLTTLLALALAGAIWGCAPVRSKRRFTEEQWELLEFLADKEDGKDRRSRSSLAERNSRSRHESKRLKLQQEEQFDALASDLDDSDYKVFAAAWKNVEPQHRSVFLKWLAAQKAGLRAAAEEPRQAEESRRNRRPRDPSERNARRDEPRTSFRDERDRGDRDNREVDDPYGRRSTRSREVEPLGRSRRSRGWSQYVSTASDRRTPAEADRPLAARRDPPPAHPFRRRRPARTEAERASPPNTPPQPTAQATDPATVAALEQRILKELAAAGSAPAAEVLQASASRRTREPFPPTLPAAQPAVPPAAESAPHTPQTAAPEHWRMLLRKTIASLEAAQITSDGKSADGYPMQKLQAYLRLLYLLDERKSDALTPIDSLDESQRQSWLHLLHSLVIQLQQDYTGPAGLQFAAAAHELREAERFLAASSKLRLPEIALCKSVSSFGVYTPMPPHELKPGAPVLLYFEVVNLVSDETPQGFQTELQTGYSILNDAGEAVANGEFPAAREVCRNHRRDYFVRYHMRLPKSLQPGSYTLQLEVNDIKGNKYARNSVSFRVVR